MDVILKMKQHHVDWFLNKVLEEYQKFHDLYVQGERHYNIQQRAEDLGDALGYCVSMNNIGNSEYEISSFKREKSDEYHMMPFTADEMDFHPDRHRINATIEDRIYDVKKLESEQNRKDNIGYFLRGSVFTVLLVPILYFCLS